VTTAVSITPHSGLNNDEVDKLVHDAEKNRDDDAARSELAELRNQSDTLLYTTEQALEGYADLISAELVAEIRRDCELLRVAVARTDQGAIRAAYSQLEGAAFRISESMYQE